MKKRSSLYLILAFFCLVVAGWFHGTFKKPEIKLEKQSSAINVDQQFLNLFSIGQNRMLADLLWIVTLLESDHAHYKNKDLNSWLYLRFNSIIGLDPKFKRAYQFGGIYLNIIKDDLYGSEQIFEKGYQRFPNDYRILYNYGFLLAYELKNFEKAVEVYTQLLSHPKAPPFIKSLIAKLKFEDTGDLNITYQLLYDMYKQEPEESNLRYKLAAELYAIKAEIDLKCLNENGSSSCDRRDFKGETYLYINGEYRAREKFNKYQLYKNKKAPNKGAPSFEN